MKVFIVLIIVFCFASLTLAEDIKIHDEHYDLKYGIEENKVYNKDWSLQYRDGSGLTRTPVPESFEHLIRSYSNTDSGVDSNTFRVFTGT